MDWFLYDKSLRHERVNVKSMKPQLLHMWNLKYCDRNLASNLYLITVTNTLDALT